MTRLRQRLADDAGVSLVELLIAVVLMAVIGGAVTTSLVQGMQLTMSTQNRFDALADLQKSVDRITRELRAADPIVRANSNDDTAVVEVYRDQAFAEKLRYTFYFCQADKVVKVRREVLPAGAPTTPSCASADPTLLTNVTRGTRIDGTTIPVFQYLRADGVTPEPTDSAKVYRLVVTVKRAVVHQSDDVQVQTEVRLRNARG